MPKKRSRVESGVRIQVDDIQPQVTAGPSESTYNTTTTTKQVTLRPGKRGRYAQDVSHTEIEEMADAAGDYEAMLDDDGILPDADFGEAFSEDTPDPESVREEVEADAENIKKTVRNTILHL